MDNVGENKNREYCCDEVELMDYVKVILKWKWFIAILFVSAVGTAGVVSKFVLPDIYEVQTILEIGSVRGGLESSVQVVEKVNENAYLALTDMDFLSSDIKAECPEGTDLVQISAETSNAERTKTILSEINQLIVSSHREEFEKRTKEIQKEITGIQKELNFIKTRKAYTESIAQLYLKVSGLEEMLSGAKMTRIIKEPTVSEHPIGPNIIFNIVAAGISALFFGVFLAFVLEWWKSYERN